MSMKEKKHEQILVYETNLKNAFGDKFTGFKNENFELIIPPNELVDTILSLKNDFNFIMLLDVCGVDNLNRFKSGSRCEKRFESVYHLLNMESHSRIRVRVFCDDAEQIPSITTIFPVAEWFEQEAWDMLGINYEGIKQERLLNHSLFVGHPLRKDFTQTNVEDDSVGKPNIYWEARNELSDSSNLGSEWLNTGLDHPILSGGPRIIPKLEGEIIKDVKVELGYFHRGMEKICEGRKYNQIVTYAERLNSASTEMNSIGWCKAIEDLMGITIPERAQSLRMIVAELSRIMDHFMMISNLSMTTGVTANVAFCMKQREIVYGLLEKIAGGRINLSLCQIGGVSFDIPNGWIFDCFEAIKVLGKNLEKISKMFSRNRIFMDRTKVCSVSAAKAIEWGYTGPCLRASGVNYDIRKKSPYYFYSDVDFEIPLGINGDTYDRYLVRLEEIRQSLRIVGQLLDNLPMDGIQIDDVLVSLPPKEQVSSCKGAFLDHFNLIVKGIEPPVGEIYSATEAANGELGFYVVSDGTATPYRVKVRPPCFPVYQSFSEIIKDVFLSDALCTLATMNIKAGELDR